MTSAPNIANSRRSPLSGVVALPGRIWRLAGAAATHALPPWRSGGVLPAYTDQADTLPKRLANAGQWAGGAVFLVLYGMAFSLYGLVFPALFLVPIIALAGLILWALPDAKVAPTRTMAVLFMVTTATIIIWPNYLALTLPGLPWITVSRLADGPLVAIFLYCLSISDGVRRRIRGVFGPTPVILNLYLAFIAIQAITLPFSVRIGSSVQTFVLDQISWTATFFIASYVFSFKKWATRWAGLLWVVAVVQTALSFWEHHLGHVIWLEHIPSFLQVSSPSVAVTLTPKIRGAYRVQGTFAGPIQLGEFLVLCFTFILHFAVEGRKLSTRILACISGPFLLAASLFSGSRSSAVGFVVSMALYALYTAAKRWRLRPRGLIAPIFVFAYPALGLTALLAVFFVHKLNKMIFGSGLQAASSEARAEQWALAIPKILKRPWGYGSGQGNEVLGFFSPGGFSTTDVYYISVLLDWGVIGCIIFLALFLAAGVIGLIFAVVETVEDWEISMIAPASINMFSFLVIKSVFNQVDNHLLFFSVLGMICAFIWRARQERLPEPVVERQTRARLVRSPRARLGLNG